LRNRELQKWRQIDANGRAFVKLNLNLQSRREPLRRVAQIVITQSNLLEAFGIHEMMMRAVRIQVFHLVLFEGHPLDRIHRAKAMLERRAGANAAQLGLDHRTQIAGRMMSKFNYSARFAFKDDYHASSDLSCWDCHSVFGSFYLVLGATATDKSFDAIANDVV